MLCRIYMLYKLVIHCPVFFRLDNMLVLRRTEVLARDAGGAREHGAGDLPVPRPLVSRRVVGDAVLVDFVLQATEA